MDGPDHNKLLNDVLNEKTKEAMSKFIEKVNTRIDSTAKTRGSHWHMLHALYFFIVFLF